jgi:hypothetical protein
MIHINDRVYSNTNVEVLGTAKRWEIVVMKGTVVHRKNIYKWIFFLFGLSRGLSERRP